MSHPEFTAGQEVFPVRRLLVGMSDAAHSGAVAGVLQKSERQSASTLVLQPMSLRQTPWPGDGRVRGFPSGAVCRLARSVTNARLFRTRRAGTSAGPGRSVKTTGSIGGPPIIEKSVLKTPLQRPTFKVSDPVGHQPIGHFGANRQFMEAIYCFRRGQGHHPPCFAKSAAKDVCQPSSPAAGHSVAGLSH